MQLTFTPHHFSNWWQEWKWSFTGPQTGAHRAATRFTGAEILKYSRLRWSCSACQGKEGIGLRSTVSKLAKSNLRSKDIKSFTIPRPLWSSVVLIRPAGPQVSKSPSKQWSSAQAPGQETAKVSQPTPGNSYSLWKTTVRQLGWLTLGYIKVSLVLLGSAETMEFCVPNTSAIPITASTHQEFKSHRPSKTLSTREAFNSSYNSEQGWS